MLRFKNESEYKKRFRERVLSGSTDRPVHKDNKRGIEVDGLYETAVQAIRDIQGIMRDQLSTEPYGVSIEVDGSLRCDIDNAAKGILDSLCKVGFADDKQIKKLTICESDYL